MACGKSKDLTERTQPDKILRGKAFKFASGPKFAGYQRGLATSFLIKSLVEVVLLLSPITNSQMNFIGRLLEHSRDEFSRVTGDEFSKVYSSLRENIWVVGLADMQSLSKYNKEIKYLLCAIDLFSKLVVPFKRQNRNCYY